MNRKSRHQPRKRPISARGQAGTNRVRSIGRKDAVDVLGFCEDFLAAMILRERVMIAMQPQETRAKVPPGELIESTFAAQMGRFRGIEELADSSSADLVALKRKLEDYAAHRTTEVLSGLGAKLRKRRRLADVERARQSLSALAGLTRGAAGKKMQRGMAEVAAAERELEVLDKTMGLGGLLSNAARARSRVLISEVDRLGKEFQELGITGSASRASVGRAAGIAGGDDRDVAKELDRIERKRPELGLLTGKLLDPRLLR